MACPGSPTLKAKALQFPIPCSWPFLQETWSKSDSGTRPGSSTSPRSSTSPCSVGSYEGSQAGKCLGSWEEPERGAPRKKGIFWKDQMLGPQRDLVGFPPLSPITPLPTFLLGCFCLPPTSSALGASMQVLN